MGRLQGSWRKGAHPVEVVARALAVEEALAVRGDVRLLLLELLGLGNKSEPVRGAPSPHVCSFGLPGRALCETPAENASYSAALSATLARCGRGISNTCFVHQKSGSARPRSRAGRRRARGAPTSYFRMRHAGVLGAILQVLTAPTPGQNLSELIRPSERRIPAACTARARERVPCTPAHRPAPMRPAPAMRGEPVGMAQRAEKRSGLPRVYKHRHGLYLGTRPSTLRATGSFKSPGGPRPPSFPPPTFPPPPPPDSAAGTPTARSPPP